MQQGGILLKKYAAIIATGLIVVTCSSCGSTIALSQEQNDRAAEYIAGVLLKYDKKYNSKLIPSTVEPVQTQNPEPTQNPEQQKATSAPKGTEKPKDNEGQKVKPADLLNDDTIKIAYQSFSLQDSYKEKESGIQIDAKKNQKLAVLKFNIKNTSKKSTKVNLSSKELSYRLIVNGKKTYKPLLTITLNDIQYFEETLKGKERKELNLIFAIDKTKAKEMELLITKGNKSAAVAMK